ncbi:MAG TPA: hypothetical protein VJ063_17485 [Verrucomicrobiae bacterium]|nr:hypothetical protein [Verrucomicrobiae bacterium]
MRIKLEPGQPSTRQPPTFMTVDELPDVGETLRTENSEVFEIMKITRTPDTKEHDAVVLVKDRMSGAVAR